MNAQQLAAAQTIRAHLSPEMAALWDDAHLSDVYEMQAPEPDPHAGALAAFGRRYRLGYVDAFIARRVGTDPALLANTVLHFDSGNETRFGWRYMRTRYGWARKRYESARRICRDAGLMTERDGVGHDRRKRLCVDAEAYARIEAEEMRLAFNMACRTPALAYMVRGLAVNLADDGDEAEDDDEADEMECQTPVDNLENEGLPLGQSGTMQGLPLGQNGTFDCPDSGHSLEEVKGKRISKSFGIPARQREPGEDDDEDIKPPPAAPAKPATDTEAAAETLIRGMGAMGLDVEPDAVRAFCKLRSVTPAEASGAILAGRNSPNSDNIGGFNYFKTVIENARKEGRKPGAPVGHIPTARNHALEEIKRINGEQKRVTAVGESAAADALAAARAARSRARSRS